MQQREQAFSHQGPCVHDMSWTHGLGLTTAGPSHTQAHVSTFTHPGPRVHDSRPFTHPGPSPRACVHACTRVCVHVCWGGGGAKTRIRSMPAAATVTAMPSSQAARQVLLAGPDRRHTAHGTWHTAHGTWHMVHGTRWHTMAHSTWHTMVQPPICAVRVG